MTKYNYKPREKNSDSPRAKSSDQEDASAEQLLRGSLYEAERTRTPFDEQRTASFHTVFSLNPTRGVSRLRDLVTVSGTGAAIDEVDGEIAVTAGTDANGSARIATVERGQYVAGTSAQAGIGLRCGNDPVDDQDVRWGYFDETGGNGFMFGHDAQGLYINRLRDGNDNIVRRASWDDPLDGTGPSGASYTTQVGAVWQIDFVWYGYGTIEFSLLVDAGRGRKERVVVHRMNVSGTNSIVDPNQPITVSVKNGASVPSGEVTAHIGGRQFSIGRSDTANPRRDVSEQLDTYTMTAATDVWEPVMAFQEKATFGPSGRINTARCAFHGYKMASDQDIDIKIEADASVTATFNTASGWDANESATEWTLASDGAITVNTAGLPLHRDFLRDVGNNKNTQGQIAQDMQQVIGDGQVFVVYVRHKGTPAVLDIIASIQERW